MISHPPAHPPSSTVGSPLRLPNAAILLTALAVLFLPRQGHGTVPADGAPATSVRSLDLALLVADAPLTRPFVPPPAPPRRAARADASTSPAAASSVLFAEAPVPTPASLPSDPLAATPAPRPPAATATATAATAAGSPAPAAGNGGILLNFQNASLGDVLNYLSSAAGFVIIQDQPVSGTVNVVSRQPLSTDEAVDLLNSVLIEKGFVALRNKRILKIVPRENAEKRDLPVVTGSDPTQIPRLDNMVTQIIPVRYAEVAKLVDSLRPLISERATITSNDSSNAILLTDTQTNIHRIAEIVRALDTSISGISSLRIFQLRFADSKGLADIITTLFAPTASATNNGQQGGNNRGQGGGGNPNFGGGGNRGGGGNNGAPAAPPSEARQAASRVVAVADEQSNSIVVSAPEEYMPNIAEVVQRLDTNVSDVGETRIFRLLYADATELAGILTSLYADTSSITTGGTTGAGQNRGGQQGGGGGGGFQQQFQQFLQRQGDSRSDRALLQARVVAVADPRTNSVLVSASHATMNQVALQVARLDATDVRKQHVYVHTLSHADPDNVAAILRGMYSVDTNNTAQSLQPSASRLFNRTTSGASSDITGSLNSSGTAGGR